MIKQFGSFALTSALALTAGCIAEEVETGSTMEALGGGTYVACTGDLVYFDAACRAPVWIDRNLVGAGATRIGVLGDASAVSGSGGQTLYLVETTDPSAYAIDAYELSKDRAAVGQPSRGGYAIAAKRSISFGPVAGADDEVALTQRLVEPVRTSSGKWTWQQRLYERHVIAADGTARRCVNGACTTTTLGPPLSQYSAGGSECTDFAGYVEDYVATVCLMDTWGFALTEGVGAAGLVWLQSFNAMETIDAGLAMAGMFLQLSESCDDLGRQAEQLASDVLACAQDPDSGDGSDGGGPGGVPDADTTLPTSLLPAVNCDDHDHVETDTKVTVGVDGERCTTETDQQHDCEPATDLDAASTGDCQCVVQTTGSYTVCI